MCHTCCGLRLAEQISLNQEGPATFVYRFRGPGVDGNYYAPHASEVPFVLNQGTSLSEEDQFRIPWNQNLSDSMVSAWVNMARDGTPNIENRIEGVNVEWDRFDAKEGKVLMLQNGDGGIRNVVDFKKNYRNNVCDYWYDEIGKDVIKTICHDFTGLGP